MEEVVKPLRIAETTDTLFKTEETDASFVITHTSSAERQKRCAIDVDISTQSVLHDAEE